MVKNEINALIDCAIVDPNSGYVACNGKAGELQMFDVKSRIVRISHEVCTVASHSAGCGLIYVADCSLCPSVEEGSPLAHVRAFGLRVQVRSDSRRSILVIVLSPRAIPLVFDDTPNSLDVQVC